MILSLGFGFSFDRSVRADDFPCLVNDLVESLQGRPDIFAREHPCQYIPGHCQGIGPVDFLTMSALFIRMVFFPYFLLYGESISGGKGHQKDFRVKILFDRRGCFPGEFLHPAL